MKKLMFLVFGAFVALGSYAQTQLNIQSPPFYVKSGFTLHAGTGWVTDLGSDQIGGPVFDNPTYDYIAALGYKVRLMLVNKWYFIDLDVQGGISRISVPYFRFANGLHGDLIPNGNKRHQYLHFAFIPTWNYKIFSHAYLGAGLAPTLYYILSDDKAKYDNILKLDAPFTLCAGYDFGFLDLSLNGKLGLINNAVDDYNYTKGRLSNWQLQVFVPF
jgi:hypothetical protein